MGCGIITVNEANDWINTNRFITKLCQSVEVGFFPLFLKKKKLTTKLLERSIAPSAERAGNITERWGESHIWSVLLWSDVVRRLCVSAPHGRDCEDPCGWKRDQISLNSKKFMCSSWLSAFTKKHFSHLFNVKEKTGFFWSKWKKKPSFKFH